MTSRLLLVEDSPGLLVTIPDVLSEEGYEVATEADGEAGSGRAPCEAFDLLILDVMLPRKDGFDVCRTVRQQGNDVAILMLTAKTQVA